VGGHLHGAVERGGLADPAAGVGVVIHLDDGGALNLREEPFFTLFGRSKSWIARPDGEYLDLALSTVRTEEREGYIRRLKASWSSSASACRSYWRRTGRAVGSSSHGQYALDRSPRRWSSWSGWRPTRAVSGASM
jgi:hypothetical protein